MDIRHCSPAGAVVAQCSDEERCTVLNCDVCLKEIPADAGHGDTLDYVYHYCGLDCLGTWQERVAMRGTESG